MQWSHLIPSPSILQLCADVSGKFGLNKLHKKTLFNLVSSPFSSCSQRFVPAAGQRGADLSPLLWGHTGLALSQRSPAPHPVSAPALHGGGPQRQQLWAHHCLRQALWGVPRSPALPGERWGPRAPGRRPPGILPPAEGALLQPPAWGEGGPLPAGYTASGHQQEDRLISLRAERGLDSSPVPGLPPY